MQKKLLMLLGIVIATLIFFIGLQTTMTGWVSKECDPGWGCKDETTRAYQNSDCSWGNYMNCYNGFCDNGICCVNDCREFGKKACTNDIKRICGNNDNDVCYEWVDTVCKEGCFNGECIGEETVEVTPEEEEEEVEEEPMLSPEPAVEEDIRDGSELLIDCSTYNKEDCLKAEQCKFKRTWWTLWISGRCIQRENGI